MFKTSAIGWWAIGIFTSVPVLMWLTMKPVGDRIITKGITLTSMGQLLSLTGFILFALSMVLSARLKIFEPFFGGMNKVYVVHHLIGGIAFILLMLHPLFLGGTYLFISFKAAALFLIPLTNWAVNFATVALLSMMLLLIFTYYVPLQYEVWRFTHQFLGVAFIFATLHIILIRSDTSLNPVLKWYLLTFAAAGIIAYLYRTVLGRWLVRRHRYELIAVRILNDNIFELDMKPLGKPLSFLPGQFVFMGIKKGFVSTEFHPYSISSSPVESTLRLSIKALGDYTDALHMIKQGAEVAVEGAYGMFSSSKYPDKKQLWIAGGIGITPFLSMARLLNNPTVKIDLLYIVRKEAELVYWPELAAIAKQNPLFKAYPYESAKYGRIKIELIVKLIPDLLEREIFLCGPPPMMISMRKQLRSVEVPNDRIHSEEFQML